MTDHPLQDIIDQLRGDAKIETAGGNRRLPVTPDRGTRLVVDGVLNLFASPVDAHGVRTGPAVFISAFNRGDLVARVRVQHEGMTLELVPEQDASFAIVDLDQCIEHQPAHVIDSISHSTARVTRGLAPDGLPDRPRRMDRVTDSMKLEASEAMTTVGTRWLRIEQGSVKWCDKATLEPGSLVLLQPGTWLVATDAVTVTTWSPDAQNASESIASMLAFERAVLTGRFHQIEAESDARFVDEVNRREVADYQAQTAGVSRIRHSMGVFAQSSTLQEPGETPLTSVCRLLAEDMGVDVSEFRPPAEGGDFDESLRRFTEVTHVHFRQVQLMTGWWKREHGPLLGVMKDTGAPVALRQGFLRRYQACTANPDGTMTIRRVRKSLAEQIDAQVWMPYRPLPETPLNFLGVSWFAMRGLWCELGLVIGMAIAAAILAITIPIATALLVDSIIPISDWVGLQTLIAALVAVAFTSALLKLLAGFVLIRMRAKGSFQLMAATVARALAVPSSFMRQYTAGDLAQRIWGIEKIRHKITKAGLRVIGSSAMIVSFSAVILWYGVEYLVIALVLLIPPLVVLIITCLINLKLNRTIQDTSGRLQGLSLEILAGIDRIRQARAESRIFRRWALVFAAQRQASYRAGYSSIFYRVTMGCYPIVTTLVLYLVFSVKIFGLTALSSEGMLRAIETQTPVAQSTRQPTETESKTTSTGALTTGDFLAFMAAFSGLLAAAMGIGAAVLPVLVLKPVFDRLTPLLNEMPETSVRRSPPGVLSGEVSLRGVRFAYQESDRPVVDGLSFDVEPGEFVAIVGASGSGKSTIIRLLVGLERPSKGDVMYNGRSLWDLDLTAVRRQIGTVLQDATIIPGSILENIIGGTNCDEEDAWRAAKAASIDDEITRMPMKMMTQVSSSVISGGQMKQLLIARALVARPRLILMDEATSSLDDIAQARVSESLGKLDITRIVVAHRLSSIGGADRIIVVDAGKIVQEGTYDDLVGSPGEFQDLVRRQVL